MKELEPRKPALDKNGFFQILEEVIPNNSDVVVIYSGIWTFAHLFQKEPLQVADFILDCLDQYVGEERTLILPAFFASDFVKTKIFDLKRSLPRESGLLSITALKRESFTRTHNPMHGYLVRGPMKKDVLSLKSTTSWGDDSIIGWMIDVNARICPLGLPWHQASTPFHRIEEILQVPYRYYKKFNGQLFNDGEFVANCSEIKYSYPLRTTLEFDYSLVTSTLQNNFQTKSSHDSRVPMESANAEDILKASRQVLDKDIYAYVKNKTDAIEWVEKYKSMEIDSLSSDERYL